ncbi:hypothetical protein A2U01_0056462, partial [Trifolium medium]|nr:hypothetical protein [Trifolium medium]
GIFVYVSMSATGKMFRCDDSFEGLATCS